ncbi:Uncharacterised protein [Stutzerimonas stutzeri]|uniref:hypothetical protein n=1 Tax=Stutzerimonas stutzeri subgroup TaxID=578833 RepID=UPI000C6EF715|nr:MULTISPECIES: hypothetical protein [Stutzerimonas stutzeri subgroup]MCQ2048653.1 hypothetical protein [Stutzerimonas kunmingensis]PKR25765.1 hypothetical protein CXK90_19350 [Stutzerimonas stutzeri]QQC11552.1 hypothetical protein I6I22_01730 [Stutzerimonas stutzeri]VEI29687.1 Uncharacterised protein [Stutzerimonas stutzeri]
MAPENLDNTKKKKNWIVPTITTLVGVAVSVLVAWYQISLSEEQIQEAEKERSKSVKSELIQIVEEHVINQDQLDISRLSRLAEFRAREERLLITPTVSEIVEGAEFNIIKSQYLEYEKKQKFKEIFNEIYNEIYTPDKANYTGISENAVNDILASINGGNNKDASTKVIKLATDFSSRIEELEAKNKSRETKSFTDFVRILIDKPEVLIIAFFAYAIMLYGITMYLRKLRSDKLLRVKLQSEIMEDYVRERNEFMHQKYKSSLPDNE